MREFTVFTPRDIEAETYVAQVEAHTGVPHNMVVRARDLFIIVPAEFTVANPDQDGECYFDDIKDDTLDSLVSEWEDYMDTWEESENETDPMTWIVAEDGLRTYTWTGTTGTLIMKMLADWE